MSQTTLLSNVSKTGSYPVNVDISAPSNCGTLWLIINTTFTEQQLYELPAIRVQILTGSNDVIYNFDVIMETVNNNVTPIGSVEPYSIPIYDIPETCKMSVTPLFDKYALDAHNETVEVGNVSILPTTEKGIVDSNDTSSYLWTTPTQTFDVSIYFDDENINSGGGGGGSTPTSASDVTYDGTMSGLSATNVQDAIDEVQDNIDNLPEPMLFKGTVGTGGTITSLPTASEQNNGFTYKVITAGTYQGIVAEVGDTVISNGTEWTLIPSGDEPSGTVTNVAVSSTDGSITISGSPITSSGTIDLSVNADNALSNSSTKPLQNQVITNILTPISETEYGNITTYTNPLYFIYEDAQ